MNFHTKKSLKKFFCQTVLQSDFRSIHKDVLGKTVTDRISGKEMVILG